MGVTTPGDSAAGKYEFRTSAATAAGRGPSSSGRCRLGRGLCLPFCRLMNNGPGSQGLNLGVCKVRGHILFRTLWQATLLAKKTVIIPKAATAPCTNSTVLQTSRPESALQVVGCAPHASAGLQARSCVQSALEQPTDRRHNSKPNFPTLVAGRMTCARRSNCLKPGQNATDAWGRLFGCASLRQMITTARLKSAQIILIYNLDLVRNGVCSSLTCCEVSPRDPCQAQST